MSIKRKIDKNHLNLVVFKKTYVIILSLTLLGIKDAFYLYFIRILLHKKNAYYFIFSNLIKIFLKKFSNALLKTI